MLIFRKQFQIVDKAVSKCHENNFGNILIVTVTAIALFLHHNKTSRYGEEGFRETYNSLPPLLPILRITNKIIPSGDTKINPLKFKKLT